MTMNERTGQWCARAYSAAFWALWTGQWVIIDVYNRYESKSLDAESFNSAFTDLGEAFLEGSWHFSIQDLQNCLYIFSGSISTQITGKQAEEVCECTHTKLNTSCYGYENSNRCYIDSRSMFLSVNVFVVLWVWFGKLLESLFKLKWVIWIEYIR